MDKKSTAKEEQKLNTSGRPGTAATARRSTNASDASKRPSTASGKNSLTSSLKESKSLKNPSAGGKPKFDLQKSLA